MKFEGITDYDDVEAKIRERLLSATKKDLEWLEGRVQYVTTRLQSEKKGSDFESKMKDLLHDINEKIDAIDIGERAGEKAGKAFLLASVSCIEVNEHREKCEKMRSSYQQAEAKGDKAKGARERLN